MTIYDLIAAAAKHLTGKPCLIRFGKTSLVGAKGCTRLGADGVAIVELPSRYEPDFLLSFCHEMAHVSLGHAAQLNPTATAAPPGSFTKRTSAAVLRPEWESQADALAKTWLDYLKATIPGSVGVTWERVTLECALQALINFDKGEKEK